MWEALIAAIIAAGLQSAGASQAQGNMNDALAANLVQQRKRQQQASEVATQSTQQSAPDVAQKQIGAGQQQALDAYQRLSAAPVSSAALPFSQNPQQVVQSQQQQGQSNQARSQLAGYSNWNMLQAIKDMRAQQQLSVLANYSRGEAGVLPFALQDAQHSGDKLSALGSIIGAVGGAYGAGAGVGSQAGLLARMGAQGYI